MPKAKNFNLLRDEVMARPGASERVAALREELLAEVGLYDPSFPGGFTGSAR